MYLAVDVGGTKTLIGYFSDRGHLEKEEHFSTPRNYSAFLDELIKQIQYKIDISTLRGICVGLPSSLIDRSLHKAEKFTNLNWHDVDIIRDLSRYFPCRIYFENDAKLAAYYEAQELSSKYKRVLYITLSTGIGYALVNNLRIDENIGDAGGSDIYINIDGHSLSWEEIASGKALVETYGKMASEINDQHIWRKYAQIVAMGLIELIAVINPEVIAIGGSVGEHFHKYGDLLRSELSKYSLPSTKLPEIIKAKEPTRAVIYGCYYYARNEYHG